MPIKRTEVTKMTTIRAKQQLINKVSKQIKEQYKPEKIILFGSFAWGKPTKDSDLDLLIIKQTNKNYFQRIPEVRSYLHNFDQAFDILVMTPKEVSKRLRLRDFFVEEIIKKGKIIYDGRQS